MKIEIASINVTDRAYVNSPPRKLSVLLECTGTHEEQLAFLIEACQFVQSTNKLFAPENEESA